MKWHVGTEQAQAFQQVGGRKFGYAFGSYVASPKARSDVQWVPVPAILVVGARRIFGPGRRRGLRPSRLRADAHSRRSVDGIPVHDLLGGGFAKYLIFLSYSHCL